MVIQKREKKKNLVCTSTSSITTYSWYNRHALFQIFEASAFVQSTLLMNLINYEILEVQNYSLLVFEDQGSANCIVYTYQF